MKTLQRKVSKFIIYIISYKHFNSFRTYMFLRFRSIIFNYTVIMVNKDCHTGNAYDRQIAVKCVPACS